MENLMKPLVLTLALLSSAAHAEFWTGNELHKRLNGDMAERRTGMTYIAGAADAIQGEVYCPPGNINLGQVVDIVERQLRDSAALRHEYSADIFVRVALSNVWPCAEKRGTGI
jgi:hypothetical protein